MECEGGGGKGGGEEGKNGELGNGGTGTALQDAGREKPRGKARGFSLAAFANCE